MADGWRKYLGVATGSPRYEWDENDRLAMDEIKGWEGSEPAPDGNGLFGYYDSKGWPTQGYGNRVPGGKQDKSRAGELIPGLRMSFEEADSLFEKDYAHHKAGAEKGPGWGKASPRQQRGLTNLAFNMGPSWWKGWRETPKAMNAGNWAEVARLLKKSQWYDDVGGNKYDADPSKASDRGPYTLGLFAPVEEPERLVAAYGHGGPIRDSHEGIIGL